jgi:hypothetical protein
MPHLWYDVGDVCAAWELLLQAGADMPALLEHSSAFVYDLLDVTRELLSKIAGRFWADIATAYKAGSRDELCAAGQSLTSLLQDLDRLLGCHHGFMLGPVLQRARDYAAVCYDAAGAGAAGKAAAPGSPDVEMADAGAAAADSWGASNKRALEGIAPLIKGGSSSSLGSSDTGEQLMMLAEADMGIMLPEASEQHQQQELAQFYEWNLRTQLTIWGTSAAAGDSEVSDYANKEWNGLIGTFYLPRWQAWLSRLEADLEQGRAYDAPAWRLEVLMMTYRWIATGSTQAARAGTEGVPLQQPAHVSAIALTPQGDALALSRAAYDKYGRLLAPGCAATAATAAAAAAAAAAGLPIPPAASSIAATAAAAAAAAAAVVGAAAGAAAAAVAGSGAAAGVVKVVA